MNATSEVLPLEVGQLGNLEARILRNLRAAVEDWDEVCSALGPWEASNLAGDAVAEGTQSQHHAWVVELISWGNVMRQMTGHPGFPDHTLADRVESRLRHLQDKLALWHGEMSSEQQERILRTAFV